MRFRVPEESAENEYHPNNFSRSESKEKIHNFQRQIQFWQILKKPVGRWHARRCFPPLIVCIRKLPSICCRGGTIFREVSGFLPQKHGLSSKELLICGCRRPLSAGLPHNFSRRQRKPLSRYLPPPEMSLPSVPTILPPIRSPLFPAEDIPGIPDRSNRIWSLPVSTSPAVLSGAVTNPEAAPPWLLLL